MQPFSEHHICGHLLYPHHLIFQRNLFVFPYLKCVSHYASYNEPVHPPSLPYGKVLTLMCTASLYLLSTVPHCLITLVSAASLYLLSDAPAELGARPLASFVD